MGSDRHFAWQQSLGPRQKSRYSITSLARASSEGGTDQQPFDDRRAGFLTAKCDQNVHSVQRLRDRALSAKFAAKFPPLLEPRWPIRPNASDSLSPAWST